MPSYASDTAYRWAKGLPVINPMTRARVQIGTSLDFPVVSGHSEFLGMIAGIDDGSVELDDLGLWASIKQWLVSRWLSWKMSDTKFDASAFNAIAGSITPVSGVDPVATEANLQYIEQRLFPVLSIKFVARLAFPATSTNGNLRN